MLTVVQNSGGRSSAYMTEMLLRNRLPDQQILVLFENTGRERDETLDFVHKCHLRWLELYNHPVTWIEYGGSSWFTLVDYSTAHRISDIGKKSPFQLLIEKRNYLPNRVARFCTQDLKIRPAKKYVQSLGFNSWVQCIGIRYDEPKRWNKKDTISQKEVFTQRFPLVEWNITKQDVDHFWRGMPFDLQLKAHEGNCDLCFLKGAGKKKRIIRDVPGSAAWWIEMENKIGSTFRSEYSYKNLLDGVKNSPEFEFRDDYECDIDCSCFID